MPRSTPGSGESDDRHVTTRACRLEDLFVAPWLAHARVGNPRFPTDDEVDAREVADLVAFLDSIDQATHPFAVPPGDDLCLGE